jgi:cell division protein ZapA
MSVSKPVDVIIMGREFTVSCTDEERQGLMDAVSYLDKKMCEIRDSGKIAGVDRIAIMAALNLSHEVLNTKTGDIDTGEYKRRINAMQNQIDEALAGKDNSGQTSLL